MRLRERIASALALQTSRWVVRLLALVIAIVAVPALFLIVSLPGTGMVGLVLVWVYVYGVVGAVPAVVLLGIPGLIIIDLTRWRGLAPLLLLGGLVGGVAGVMSVSLLGQAGLGERVIGWMLAVPLGIGLGEVSALAYWAASHWVERWIHDIKEETELRASLTPEDRERFASRLDRSPW